MKRNIKNNHSSSPIKLSHEREEKKEILDLIEIEISRINNSHQKHGWNQWAIICSLAALIWLLLSQFEHDSELLYIKESIILLVTISIYFYLLYFTYNLSKTPKNQNYRFGGSSNFSDKKLALLFLCLVLLSTIVLTFSSTQLNNATKIVTFSYLALSFIIILLLYSLDYINWPLPKKIEQNIFVNIFVMLIFLLTSISLSKQLNTFPKNPLPIDSIKFSSIIDSISLLIFFFLVNPTNPPFLYNLIEIQRQLLLGNISSSDAKKITETIIWGLSFSNTIQKQINKFNLITDKLSFENNEIIENLIFEIQEIDTQPHLLSENIIETAEKVISRGRKHISHSKSDTRKLIRQLKQINRRTMISKKFFNENFTNEDSEELKSVSLSMHNKLVELSNQTDQIIKLLDGLFSKLDLW